MLSNILMPSVGQTTNEALIVKWHKKVGDPVDRGDVLFDTETDKATLEVESYAQGILRAVLCKEGDMVASGTVVAYVGKAEDLLPEENAPKPPSAGIDANDDYAPILPADTDGKKVATSVPDQEADERELAMASPKARNAAKENGVPIAEVCRKVNRTAKFADVAEYIVRQSEQTPAEDFIWLDTSSMRRAIAAKMTKSITASPQYTVSMDVDMANAITFRKNLNDYIGNDGVKVTFNDILMKCAAAAIKRYPQINSAYGEEKIKLYRTVNFGLAVSIENGLLVPVIRDVQTKSLADIALKSSEAVKAVKSGRAGADLLSGGTITLSNLGMLGAKNFTAILNYPESCILAIGKIDDKLKLIDEKVVSRPIMNITATFDHRTIDGAYGAAFLSEMKALLENPILLAY
ncbi:MAG: dihydrolipoamide acetyltransferase family protein [Clostridia bacterium]|nr:dihydrolipoamide acetyltransferase family protein [Clostridia bacterium]